MKFQVIQDQEGFTAIDLVADKMPASLASAMATFNRELRLAQADGLVAEFDGKPNADAAREAELIQLLTMLNGVFDSESNDGCTANLTVVNRPMLMAVQQCAQKLSSADSLEANAEQAAYLANAGCVCPFCGSDEIEGNEIVVNEGQASQGMGCIDCGAEWFDRYRLVGFSENEHV